MEEDHRLRLEQTKFEIPLRELSARLTEQTPHHTLNNFHASAATYRFLKIFTTNDLTRNLYRCRARLDLITSLGQRRAITVILRNLDKVSRILHKRANLQKVELFFSHLILIISPKPAKINQ